MRKALLPLVLLLTACAAPRLETPSGRPDVTVIGATRQEVHDYLINAMIARGYTVQQDSGSLLRFGKPSDSTMAAIFFGTGMYATPEARIIYSLAEYGGGVRVVATLQMVSNPGSGFEKVTDFSGGRDAAAIQRMLEQMRSALGR